MISGKFIGGDGDLSAIYDIRRRIFCGELHETENQVFDGKDTLAMHAIVFDDEGLPAAVGRALYDGGKYKLGFIGVLNDRRGRQYGEFVVRMLCDRAFNSGAKEVYLDARQKAVGFYKRIGFTICGQEPDENGFVPMVLTASNFTSRCANKKDH